MNEILKLFINDKTKFTHLYIPEKFDYQLNLIPEAKNCLSEIQFLSCDTSINDKSLIGLMEICDSIKELELFMELENNNYGFTKLIKQQKKLLKIHFFPNSKYPIYYPCDDSYYDAIENSLIKHSKSLDDFFKLWEGRRPMILKFFSNSKNIKKMMKYYKAKGIIEDYDYKLDYKEDLVWVRMCR
ncbi:unnamed protein product [Rhizophagus irregularis]|nr:unnamed protein product [Rhizophagus irregularis]